MRKSFSNPKAIVDTHVLRSYASKTTEKLGNEIPQDCRSSLALERTNRENYVLILLTVDEDEFSRVCLLSPFQVISTTRSDLYFEVYPGSNTVQNLNRTGKATFIIHESIGLLYVRGTVERLKKESAAYDKSQTLYRFIVAQVLRDSSDAAPINSQMRLDTLRIGPEYQCSFEEMRARERSIEQNRI